MLLLWVVLWGKHVIFFMTDLYDPQTTEDLSILPQALPTSLQCPGMRVSALTKIFKMAVMTCTSFLISRHISLFVSRMSSPLAHVYVYNTLSKGFYSKSSSIKCHHWIWWKIHPPVYADISKKSIIRRWIFSEIKFCSVRLTVLHDLSICESSLYFVDWCTPMCID